MQATSQENFVGTEFEKPSVEISAENHILVFRKKGVKLEALDKSTPLCNNASPRHINLQTRMRKAE